MVRLPLLLAAGLLLFCGRAAYTTFTDVTSTSGRRTGTGMAVAVLDCNADGYLDVVFTVASSAWLAVNNEGSGSFTESMLGNIACYRGISVADFNSDGIEDVVCRSTNNADPPILNQGLGDCTFSTFKPIVESANTEALFFFDVDADGLMDIFSPSAEYQWIRNNNIGGWMRVADLPGTAFNRGNGESSFIVDWTGDGFGDMALDPLAGAGDLNSFESNGDYPRTYTVFGVSDTTARSGFPLIGNFEDGNFAFADCDRDGDLDLFPGTPKDGYARDTMVYKNIGGKFAQNFSAGFLGGDPYGALFGDLNLDGYVDLVVAADSHTIVATNDGSCGFTSSFASAEGLPNFKNAFVLLDLDNDGDLDVFSASGKVALNNNNATSFLKVIPRGRGIAGYSSKVPLGSHMWMYSTSDTSRDNLLWFDELLTSQGSIQRPNFWHVGGTAPTARVDLIVTFTSNITLVVTKVAPLQHSKSFPSGSAIWNHTIEVFEPEANDVISAIRPAEIVGAPEMVAVPHGGDGVTVSASMTAVWADGFADEQLRLRVARRNGTAEFRLDSGSVWTGDRALFTGTVASISSKLATIEVRCPVDDVNSIITISLDDSPVGPLAIHSSFKAISVVSVSGTSSSATASSTSSSSTITGSFGTNEAGSTTFTTYPPSSTSSLSAGTNGAGSTSSASFPVWIMLVVAAAMICILLGAAFVFVRRKRHTSQSSSASINRLAMLPNVDSDAIINSKPPTHDTEHVVHTDVRSVVGAVHDDSSSEDVVYGGIGEVFGAFGDGSSSEDVVYGTFGEAVSRADG